MNPNGQKTRAEQRQTKKGLVILRLPALLIFSVSRISKLMGEMTSNHSHGVQRDVRRNHDPLCHSHRNRNQQQHRSHRNRCLP